MLLSFDSLNESNIRVVGCPRPRLPYGSPRQIGAGGGHHQLAAVCALETGRSFWTAPLDAVRLAPGDDAATITAQQQLRTVIGNLIEAGHHRPGDPDIQLRNANGLNPPIGGSAMYTAPAPCSGSVS